MQQRREGGGNGIIRESRALVRDWIINYPGTNEARDHVLCSERKVLVKQT